MLQFERIYHSDKNWLNINTNSRKLQQINKRPLKKLQKNTKEKKKEISFPYINPIQSIPIPKDEQDKCRLNRNGRWISRLYRCKSV